MTEQLRAGGLISDDPSTGILSVLVGSTVTTLLSIDPTGSNGLRLRGAVGSVADVTVMDRNGTVAMRVGPGSNTVSLPGTVRVGGGLEVTAGGASITGGANVVGTLSANGGLNITGGGAGINGAIVGSASLALGTGLGLWGGTPMAFRPIITGQREVSVASLAAVVQQMLNHLGASGYNFWVNASTAT